MSDMQSITPISYQEAGVLLNRSRQHIASIVSNGLLTQLPSTKQKQLIKEQVELFIDKKQVRLSMLSSDELSLWTKYKDIAENSTTTNTYTEEQVAMLIASTLHATSTLTDEEKKTFSLIFLLLGSTLVLALGLNWIIENRQELIDKLLTHTETINKANEQAFNKIISSLNKLDSNADVNTVANVIEQTLAQG